jgi:hypothetical protein
MKAYMEAAGLAGQSDKAPLVRSALKRKRALTDRPISGTDLLRIVKRRLKAAGLVEELLLPFLPGYHRHRPAQARSAARAGSVSARPFRCANYRPLQPYGQGGFTQHRREDIDLSR